MLGLDAKDVGFFTRTERIALLVLGVWTGLLAAALAVLAIASTVSALQRVAYTVGKAAREPSSARSQGMS